MCSRLIHNLTNESGFDSFLNASQETEEKFDSNNKGQRTDIATMDFAATIDIALIECMVWRVREVGNT